MKIAMRRIIAAHWSLTWCGVLEAQVPSSARLEVVVQNAVAYVDDGIPYGQYATAQTQTPPATGGRNFRSWTLIGDVVSVNGKPAKGVAVHRAHIVSLRTAPANGQAISDVNGPLAVADYNVEIRHADGTPVGTAMLQGFLFGPPPPGAQCFDGFQSRHCRRDRGISRRSRLLRPHGNDGRGPGFDSGRPRNPPDPSGRRVEAHHESHSGRLRPKL
jgi:hypothetical protein